MRVILRPIFKQSLKLIDDAANLSTKEQDTVSGEEPAPEKIIASPDAKIEANIPEEKMDVEVEPAGQTENTELEPPPDEPSPSRSAELPKIKVVANQFDEFWERD